MAYNYDPVKAHEYYINYRKKGLKKGRRSVSGFTQSQKERWEYMKYQLSEEHKGIMKGITDWGKERRSSLSEDARARKQELSDACKEHISSLRDRVKNASKEEKAAIREEVQGLIDGLKESLRSDKEVISEGLKADKEGVKETQTNSRETEKVAYEERKTREWKKIKDKR